MLGMCVAPVVLMGYLFGNTPFFDPPKTSVDGLLLDVQTCQTGLGFHARATQSGLYSFGTQYGFTWDLPNSFSITLQPRAGLSYVDHSMIELSARGQFELGTQLLLGYDRYRVGVDYWHLSNAGTHTPNIGLDTLAVVWGFSF